MEAFTHFSFYPFYADKKNRLYIQSHSKDNLEHYTCKGLSKQFTDQNTFLDNQKENILDCKNVFHHSDGNHVTTKPPQNAS